MPEPTKSTGIKHAGGFHVNADIKVMTALSRILRPPPFREVPQAVLEGHLCGAWGRVNTQGSLSTWLLAL